MLTRSHRQNHLVYTRQKLRQQPHNLTTVLFLDESRFTARTMNVTLTLITIFEDYNFASEATRFNAQSAQTFDRTC